MSAVGHRRERWPRVKPNQIQFAATAVVSLEHPSIEGHFPGNPVVPAVVILQTIWQVAQRFVTSPVLREVTQAKFNAVLRPGKEFMIQFELSNDEVLKFICIEGGVHFASGGFKITKNLT